MGVRYCKCGAVLKFRCQICDDCRVKNYKESMQRCHDTETEKRRNQKQNGYAREYLPREGYAQVEVSPPWVPRPKAPPILTDAEQRKIDADILMRERLRCGCTHSPVRSLSREEIEQLQHQYQPAKYVREEVILPWSKRCAAEPKGTSLRRP